MVRKINHLPFTSIDHKYIIKLDEFAKIVNKHLKSDRDVFVCITGFTGEGKSTFAIELAQAHAKIRKKTYSLNKQMTWDREELLQMIDGENKLKQYDEVIHDELFLAGYNRKWQDAEQIEFIQTLNTYRDRHLLFIGCIPVFKQLDPAVRTRVRFWVHIFKRGIAVIRLQEPNSCTDDVWNLRDEATLERTKQLLKYSRNSPMVCYYDDLDDDTKKEYLELRNTKRIEAIHKTKEKSIGGNSKAYSAFNKLAMHIKKKYKYSNRQLAIISDVDRASIDIRLRKMAEAEQ